MMLSMDDINDAGLVPAYVSEQDEAAKLPPSDQPKLLIIDGTSGAGRTRVTDMLEGLDWYIADDLPPRLLRALTGMMTPDGEVRYLAIAVDVRSREFLAEFSSILTDLKESGLNYRLFFLDYSDDKLVRRRDSAHYPHPLQGDGRVLDRIATGHILSDDMRKQASIIIDTSGHSVHNLARRARTLVADEAQSDIRVTVVFFGFKYGLPVDADNVADVRFLSNPYWVGELRHLTGHDEPVANFILRKVGGVVFIEKYASLILDVFQEYAHELKPLVVFAMGCMGGKYRSVAIAKAISERLRASGQAVRTTHRDVERE